VCAPIRVTVFNTLSSGVLWKHILAKINNFVIFRFQEEVTSCVSNETIQPLQIRLSSVFWRPRVDIYQHIQYLSVTTTK
jgi:hypothetical protein